MLALLLALFDIHAELHFERLLRLAAGFVSKAKFPIALKSDLLSADNKLKSQDRRDFRGA